MEKEKKDTKKKVKASHRFIVICFVYILYYMHVLILLKVHDINLEGDA